MVNINFVPDDYIQSGESHRTNIMYLVLFALVMAAFGGSFLFIKVRASSLHAKRQKVNEKMVQAEKVIEQFEELQRKRKKMMNAALMTAELLEPVPRSVLLALVTNNLPRGVSLLRLDLEHRKTKRPTRPAARPAGNKYSAQKASNNTDSTLRESPERFLETHISLTGIAPSDIQVATYIESLVNCNLLHKVALVESKEHSIEGTTFRQFKLTAVLVNGVHLTNEDIDSIRHKANFSVQPFLAGSED